DGQFTIEIAGADGVRVFSFASGTSNSSIADAINAFAGVTGVQADVLPVNSANGVGVRFLSAGIGSDEFVSVRILDDAGLEGPSSTLGVWSLADGDFNRLGSLEQPISEAGPPTTDLGRDVRALINNQRAIVDGDTIRIDTPELAVRLTLNRNQFSEGPGLFRPGLIRLAVVGLDPAQAPPLDPDFALERLGRQFNPHGERFALDDLRSGASLNLIDGDLTRILDVIDAARRDLALVEQSGFDNLTRSAATRLSPEEAIAAAQSTRQTLLQSFTRAADIPRNDPALALQLLTPNRPKS
ncbi:MAG: flagellin hook IN motif-containing protein, partial [Planctomycetota bacterium]|nr:flagellin hook IN motif-containing protein [Planctomycetota bacterium]